MISEEARQLIQKRLQGQLSEEEKTKFEEQMKNREFREHFAQRMATGLVFQLEEEEDQKVLNFLNELKEQPQTSKVRRLIPAYWRPVAAAAVVILSVGAYLFFGRVEPITNSEIAALAEKPDAYGVKGETASADPLLGCGDVPDDQGARHTSFITCLSGKNDAEMNWYAHFSLGYSYIQRGEDGDYPLALTQLESSLAELPGDENARPHPSVIDKIEWNRLLAWVALDNPSYKTELDRVLEGEHLRDYRKRAEALSERLSQAERK